MPLSSTQHEIRQKTDRDPEQPTDQRGRLGVDVPAAIQVAPDAMPARAWAPIAATDGWFATNAAEGAGVVTMRPVQYPNKRSTISISGSSNQSLKIDPGIARYGPTQCCERGGFVTNDFSLRPMRENSEGLPCEDLASPPAFAALPTGTAAGVSSARTA